MVSLRTEVWNYGLPRASWLTWTQHAPSMKHDPEWTVERASRFWTAPSDGVYFSGSHPNSPGTPPTLRGDL